jgi:2',3'-cyclic-nucleotide 2'-phosphodiesterase (5'-nucleotidase family)
MMKLRILHFNDVHSRFEELARVASAVEELRDENTVVLDAGDNADFARMETEGTCGVISSAILNEMGVDAKVFGNNEGFAGRENSRTIVGSSWCPVVTCNVYDLQSNRKLGFLDDAVILERSGVRILVVGVTAGGWLNVFYELDRMHVKDPEEEIRRVLADYEGFDYDLLVVLSHLGLEKDKEIASHFHCVNVIIGGHSHSLLKKPLMENNVIICQAGQFGEYLGELVVDFDVEKRKAVHFDGRLISAKDYSPHPKIVKLIERHSRLADRNLSRKLYSFSVSLDHSLTEENAIGNLLADALKDMLKTEIGIINSGVLNGGIGKGAVTRKLLHHLCPSPLNPTCMEVKGVDLQTALEKSLRKEFQLGDGRGPGSRTRYLGNIQVSRNLQVKVNSGVIKSITVESQALEPDRWYSVGTSDFLQRGTGYSELANNRHERYRIEFLRDVLQTYLQKESFLNKAFQKRFIVE